MGRRHIVSELSEEQLDFVIRRIVDGDTDREVCAQFENVFKDSSLAKSSLHRWRTAAGKELVERYQLARFQAKALVEQFSIEDADKYQTVIGNIEDRLLTATREVVKQNPVKLLQVRQMEEKMRVKREELELKRQQIELEREKLRGVALDRVKLGAETLTDFLEFVGGDSVGLQFLSKNLQPFGEFLKAKYAPQN